MTNTNRAGVTRHQGTAKRHKIADGMVWVWGIVGDEIRMVSAIAMALGRRMDPAIMQG